MSRVVVQYKGLNQRESSCQSERQIQQMNLSTQGTINCKTKNMLVTALLSNTAAARLRINVVNTTGAK